MHKNKTLRTIGLILIFTFAVTSASFLIATNIALADSTGGLGGDCCGGDGG